MTTVVFSVASGFARAGVGISAVGGIDELARRTWLFIKKCLYSDSRSVSSVAQHAISVSYTHLTLPTNREV